jgi:hypothetical protein
MDLVQAHLSAQSGVVSRAQLLAAGLLPHDVRRLLRRRELVVLVPGVYVDHTGDPTWLQHAWARVLALWPAALSHESALWAEGLRVRCNPFPIQVAIDRRRSPAAPPGVRLHRLASLEQKVLWCKSPPRVRIEEGVMDVAAEAVDELAAVAVLADAVSSRKTTAERLQIALSGRSRIARRTFLVNVLDDVAHGTCSVLEQGYLDRVERPHGLPTGIRQVHDARKGSVYRDVLYVDERLIVELVGRIFHDSVADFDRDLERDLDSAVDGRDTVRLGWGQVFRRPCRTAGSVGRLLVARGWSGRPLACPSCVAEGVPYGGASC